MSIRKRPYYTPLRYPGGKRKLANYIKKLVVQNDLVGGRYVEVYAGGCAVAIELLVEGYFDNVAINDIDPAVYAFWWSVLNETDSLIKKIVDTPVDVDTWKAKREIIRHPKEYSLLEIGFSAFYLNRCNRSGILKGGVIGGLKQDGEWKIDARFNKDNLISRIELIGENSGKIKLYNDDAIDFIKKQIDVKDKPDLMYLDPPYYNKGKGLYRNFYKHDDHVMISNYVKTIENVNWLISYDNVPEIESMYEQEKKLVYALSYTAQNKIRGSELLIFSENLDPPEVNDLTKMQVS